MRETQKEATVPSSQDKMTETIPMVKEETEETAIIHQLVTSTIVSSMIWGTNGSATGHWLVRASHQAVKRGESQEVLMMEHFKTDSVFQICLSRYGCK